MSLSTHHNNQTTTPDSWTHTEFNGIPKDDNTNTLAGQRWIASQSLTRGWYQRCNRDHIRQNTATDSPVRTYGFKAETNTSHVTSGLRSIICNCRTWQGYQAAIISMDIRTFPDAIEHKVIFDALVSAQIPQHNINAIMRDYHMKTASLILSGKTTSSKHKFTKGGWQGGTAFMA